MDGLYVNEDTKDKRLGTIIHKYLLEPEDFYNCYFLQEGSDSQGMMDRLIYMLAQEGGINYESVPKFAAEIGFKWKLERLLEEIAKQENQDKLKRLIDNRGKQPISQEQLDTCNYILDSIRYHKTAFRLLNPKEGITTFREPEVFWTNSRGQKCKAKMDDINIDPLEKTIELIEIKKTAFHPKKFESTIRYRGYHRQMSWYKNEALPELLKQNDIDPSQFQILNRFIVCQDHYPNIVRVIQLDEQDLIEGQIEYERTLDAIQWHTDNNFWEKREYKDREEWIDFVNIFAVDEN